MQTSIKRTPKKDTYAKRAICVIKQDILCTRPILVGAPVAADAARLLRRHVLRYLRAIPRFEGNLSVWDAQNSGQLVSDFRGSFFPNNRPFSAL